MIRVEKLVKFYGDFCALSGVSFEVKKGEILGLLGPNGAGKTTTYRILTGYLSPTDGNVWVGDLNVKDDMDKIKRMIGYLPESAPIYKDMLVYDYLGFIADVRGVPRGDQARQIKQLAELCSLNEVMHKTVNELSKGYRQRVGIAHALMGDPEILVFDEPTSGLDPNQIIETREIIRRIGKEKTIIFSTHILSEAEATCDRLVIISSGQKVADATVAELKEQNQEQSLEKIFHKLTRGGNA